MCSLSKKKRSVGKGWGAMTEWLDLGGNRVVEQAGDLSLMAYVSAVHSPAGSLQTFQVSKPSL